LQSHAGASLLDVLANNSRVHVDLNAGSGSINSLYLRGADPNFTQVQIDGVAVNDPTNSRGGAYDLSALPLAAIERIEILPGAASSLYGSQALAGVINIVTREGIDTPEASLALSSYGGGRTSIIGG